MPRPPRHPLTSLLRRRLPRPLDRMDEAYLRLVDRRLAALVPMARGESLPPADAWSRREDRDLARRALARREASWHDGDENLVRGYLDRWGRDPRPRERAHGLLEAASALVTIDPPASALWFFLWEMESVLAGFFEADKPDAPC